MISTITFEGIIRCTKTSLEAKKEKISIEDVKIMAEDFKTSPSFKKALEEKNKKSDLGVICEYKPASPSKGSLSNLKVEDVVKVYESRGACAISVLTEDTFFKSSLENLEMARDHSNLPLIRKDFILEEYQIYEARILGASSILLMTSLYPDLKSGVALCHSLDMEPLVECSNREEIDLARSSGAHIIGINNRNFQDFSVDLRRTIKLASYVPSDIILVSESGVNGPVDLKFLAEFGADAVLVGSSIMASKNIANLGNSVNQLTTAAEGVRRGR
ncbi:MAG: indole-3-glycerol-phosphate synthase [Methanobacteriaceae archaeon]|nr:indole-3-glycerol-phosphate synthase [Methanobacteriaceae archaeon]